MLYRLKPTVVKLTIFIIRPWQFIGFNKIYIGPNIAFKLALPVRYDVENMKSKETLAMTKEVKRNGFIQRRQVKKKVVWLLLENVI